ncbi:MAG TPA: hypothetical protein HA362_01920 [Nanoarchaeota archaeon]|nr:hypothetical protein [Nanoarchaeota archaeon]
MDMLKIALVASALLFLYLLLKTRLWRRIPAVSAVFSILLFAGVIALGFLIGSVVLLVAIGIIAFMILLFIVFWLFGRAKIIKLNIGGMNAAKTPAPKKIKKIKVIR